MVFKYFIEFYMFFWFVQLSLSRLSKSCLGQKITVLDFSINNSFELIVNHPSRWAPDERCNVSLIEENTNTKHTHKWSEAQ